VLSLYGAAATLVGVARELRTLPSLMPVVRVECELEAEACDAVDDSVESALAVP
jgi:hypothetical protein